MGVFNIIKAMFQSILAGGNFGYIAKNIATIYYIIENSCFGKELTEEQKLYATALCDTYNYLLNNTITIDEIQRAVFFAKAGIVGIGPYIKPLGLLNSGLGENEDVIYLAMQIETLIFSVATKNDYHDVVDMVLSSKDKIANMVNKTIEKGKNGSLYSSLNKNVNMHLCDSAFRNIVLSYEEPI